MHKLWFAHQGKELNLSMPWDYLINTVKYTGNGNPAGVYSATSHAMAGIQSSAMGTAITTDFQLNFAGNIAEIEAAASAFQKEYHALPEPEVLCKSGALGLVHHYDPEKFSTIETIAEDAIGGYWNSQNDSKEYGMWIYRVWNNGHYEGNGVWALYRLYNGAHHYDAYMPWLYYARSGNPFYLDYGLANIRQLSDVQITHYQDKSYPHQEFYSRLQRLVGSFKHDNGFVPWGADHMVAGHGTCYNALILAYYLTGDLRLKEILIDEWQKTILTDRLNDQYKPNNTDRSVKPGRDNNNALGEMIDLYQLTYEPAILGHLSGHSERLLKYFWFWGQGIHNELTFRKTKKVKDLIISGTESFLKADGDLKKAAQPVKGFWYSHAREAVPSYVASVTGRKDFAEAALSVFDVGDRIKWSKQAAGMVMSGYCHIPDRTLYIPSLLHALEKTGVSSAFLKSKDLKPYPSGTAGNNICIIREKTDQKIVIEINGHIQKDTMDVKIYDPDFNLLIDEKIEPGIVYPKAYKIPADNKTGDYIVINGARQGGKSDKIFAPLSTLPEVYYVNFWTSLYKNMMFIKSEQEVEHSIKPHLAYAEIHSPNKSKVIAVSQKGEPMKLTLGPAGAWVTTKGMYMNARPAVVMSISPERWFSPNEKTIKFIMEMNKKK
jgi:hypothetical protein